MELWLYTSDDPFPSGPMFTGTAVECRATIEEVMATYHEELWGESAPNVWENINGDVIKMEGK